MTMDGKTMFEEARLREALGGTQTQLTLEACAQEVRAAVERFTGQRDLQDDLTLFLLRRK